MDWTTVPETSPEDVADLAGRTGLDGQPAAAGLAAGDDEDQAPQHDPPQVAANAAAQAAGNDQPDAADALSHGFGT